MSTNLRLVSPPHSLATERAVLGVIMLWAPDSCWSPSEIADVLDPTDFYRDDHAKLYELMLQRFELGEPIDMMSIVEAVHLSGNPDQYGGCSYVSGLADSVPSTENIISYAVVIRDTAAKRRLMAKLAEQHDALRRGVSVSEVRAELEATITSPGMERAKAVEHIGSVLQGTYNRVLAQAQGRSQPYYRTGIPALDDMITFNGLIRRGLTLVIARSGMGKTTLANRLAIGLAENGRRVLLCPTETSKDVRAEDLLFSLARVDQRAWGSLVMERACAQTTGRNAPYQRVVDDSMARITDAAEHLAAMPLEITDTGWTVERLCAEVTRRHRNANVDVVIVDYLQDLAPSRGVDHNRSAQVAHASKALKDLAVRLNVPIVLFAQAKHSDEVPKSRRSPSTPVNNDWLIPQMGSVQWASQCYQDAEEVWALYRHDYYADRHPSVTDLPGQGEHLTIAFRKRRIGGADTVNIPIDIATKWVGDMPADDDGGAF
jgi:replicative DNA helicase